MRPESSGKTALEIVNLMLLDKFSKVKRHVRHGIGLYGQRLYVDFIVDDRLIIESTGQTAAGSGASKLPYYILQAKECYKLPCIFRCAGNGYPKGALPWAKRQQTDRVIVLDADEFESWIQRQHGN